MAAPSVGRRSCQRQGVIPYEGIKNGGLDLFKAAAGNMGVSKGCCATAFFFCRRPAVERYLVFNR